MEQAGAAIAEAKALIQKLTDEIKELGEQIAGLAKALNEATKLRAGESAENEKTLSDAAAGKDAVEQAIAVLKKFYGSFMQTSFVQIREHQPKTTEGYERTFGINANREGKTVKDLAPETFEAGDRDASKYDESKGIIGLLDVILSDFERTIETVSSEEQAAQVAFETFEKDTNEDIADKEKSKSEKEAKKIETEDKLTEEEQNKMDAEDNLKMAEKSLADLKGQCVDGNESYEERVAKREQEIAALKEALDIFRNWDTSSAFLQKRA